MKKTDFDTLTFDAAMRLYGLKLQAEKNNDIQLRTKLLRDHPALFDKETQKLFEATAENVRQYKLMNR
jgi:hypothetical protein